MNDAVLIFPHQLFAEHPSLEAGRTIYLIEDPLYFLQYRFHVQKLILHRASMKAYEAKLVSRGYTVYYLEHVELCDTALATRLKDDSVTGLYVADVVDDWLHKKIVRTAQDIGVPLTWVSTPQFLTSEQDVRAYWGASKRHLQYTFYVWQRKRLGVLVVDDAPVGGSWSFDAENRKSLPEGIELPTHYACPSSSYIDEAKAYVITHFSDNYGSSETFAYAVTHADAENILQTFLRERLEQFGAYEDAIDVAHHTVFHSVLSPYLNNGLLTPRQVLDAVLAYAESHTVPLASFEGYVRQLIGWREFMRMVYVCDGGRMRTQNVLRATRTLPAAWWNATTGCAPIDHTIETLNTYAYTHHIVRLMVVGNMHALLGIHPDESYKWFMEWYIDAYDWVMVPNVYGMALFADGGTIVTKPYISSSRYVLKMGNYPKGEWTDMWDALYWMYVDRHRDVLARNIRAMFSVKLFDRLTEEKKEKYRLAALHAYAMLSS